MENSELVRRALAALRSEPRLGPTFKLDLIRMEPDGAALLEGEVETVAQKRLALERVAAIPDLNGIVDRIRVRPAATMSDDGIRDHLRKVFVLEPAFEGLRIAECDGENVREVRSATRDGEIEFEVQDGVVTLNGMLASLASKRLAGVLAWWIPGGRDVINGIAVMPPEEDAPILVEEAMRLVLEMDPLVDAAQVRVGVRGRVVRLTGWTKTEAMRAAAEADAWFVFGVDDVINEIEVGS